VNLRNNASVLTPAAFAIRKEYLVSAYKDGKFLKDPASRGQPPANPMTDPAGMDAMMGMMKGNMMMMVPQTLIMSWINAFFSGFVLCGSLSTRFEKGHDSVDGADVRK
jgi:ER membrane protein complex subunit 3